MTKGPDREPTITVNLELIQYKKKDDSESLGNEPTSINLAVSNLEITDFLVIPKAYKIIFFDFKEPFYKKNKNLLPRGYEYFFPSTLPELNSYLKSKEYQVVVFNYDVIPKAINQIVVEMKKKLPTTKIMITCSAISPEKAERHSKSPSGVHGYYQLPLEPRQLELEFQRIYDAHCEKA